MTPSLTRDTILIHNPKDGHKLLSIPSGELRAFVKHPDYTEQFSFPALFLDKAETVVVIGGLNGKVRLWNASNGKFIQKLEHKGREPF